MSLRLDWPSEELLISVSWYLGDYLTGANSILSSSTLILFIANP